MSPDPCQATNSTSERSNSPERRAGRKRLRPALMRISFFKRAWGKIRLRGDAPGKAAGRAPAHSSKVTNVDPGFPGRPKKLVPRRSPAGDPAPHLPNTTG